MKCIKKTLLVSMLMACFGASAQTSEGFEPWGDVAKMIKETGVEAIVQKSKKAGAFEEETWDVCLNGLTYRRTGGERSALGDSFVVQGYVYPGGTLEEMGELTENGYSSGILEDGSPEWPELVVGIWTCRGWLLRGGIQPSYFNATTVQHFEIYTETGLNQIVTNGYENNVPEPNIRPVTGGSGRSLLNRSPQTQLFIGANVFNGPNFKMTFPARVAHFKK